MGGEEKERGVGVRKRIRTEERKGKKRKWKEKNIRREIQEGKQGK